MTTFEQHARHRGGYTDLWSQEGQREHDDRRSSARHRGDDRTVEQPGQWHRNCDTDDERRRFEVVFRRLHGGL